MILGMPTGPSGRIVVDLDPAFKKEVYSALALRGSTLKEWFTQAAKGLCEDVHQPQLWNLAEAPTPYVSKNNDSN
jgi:hypothetical protein